MDVKKIDLNAPAFGEGAQKVADLIEDAHKTEAAAAISEEEVKVEEVVVAEEKPTGESDEEPERVKYSRFKKVHERALEAEREAAEWRAKAEAIESSQRSYRNAEPDGEVPSYWKELYGDESSDNWSNVKRAWEVQSRRDQEIFEKAREEAIVAVRNERQEEASRTNENLESINNHVDLVSAAAGRDLTEKEESAILDIIDDYTPKGDDGSYLGALLDPDKAWEIYELKNMAQKGPKTQARDKVASLTSASSQGDVAATEEQNKNWNPLDWNAWKKRL